MAKIIKLTEAQLNTIVKKVLEQEQNINEQITPPDPPHSGGGRMITTTGGGTSTADAGAYVSPAGLKFKDTAYDDDDPYDPYDPYDPEYPDDPNLYPKEGSYVGKMGRSPMCCKKCKNGKYKHQCDDKDRGNKLKYDGTNCVYETLSDCQLNKRMKKRKKKSKK